MKTPRRFNRNHLLRHLRIAGAVTLMSAAAAMAFVAAKTSTSSGKTSTSHFRTFDRDKLETLLGKGKGGGEPESINGPAQEDYDNRAYPATSIAAAQQVGALNAAKAIAKLPGGKSTNWQEVGPSGVPASALVASESTGATAG